MHKLMIINLVLAAALLGGCGGIPGFVVTGSGNKVSQEVALSDFDTVEAGNAFNVEITQGEAYAITLTADDNFMPYVRAEKAGSTLRLSLDPGFNGARSLKFGTLEARITMPDLREIHLSGAAHGTVDGFTRDVDAQLSGATWLKGRLASGNLRLDASGASHAELTGSAEELTLHGSGASSFDLREMRAGNARVDLSGASSAQVDVMGKLDYSLSGGSRLDYEGSPRVGQSDVSGGSSARGQ